MPIVDVLFGLAALACFAGALFITLNPTSKSPKHTFSNHWQNGSAKKNSSGTSEEFYSTAVDEETN